MGQCGDGGLKTDRQAGGGWKQEGGSLLPYFTVTRKYRAIQPELWQDSCNPRSAFWFPAP